MAESTKPSKRQNPNREALVLIDKTDTKTNDTQSQASSPELKRGLIAKIETDT